MAAIYNNAKSNYEITLAECLEKTAEKMQACGGTIAGLKATDPACYSELIQTVYAYTLKVGLKTRRAREQVQILGGESAEAEAADIFILHVMDKDEEVLGRLAADQSLGWLQTCLVNCLYDHNKKGKRKNADGAREKIVETVSDETLAQVAGEYRMEESGGGYVDQLLRVESLSALEKLMVPFLGTPLNQLMSVYRKTGSEGFVQALAREAARTYDVQLLAPQETAKAAQTLSKSRDPERALCTARCRAKKKLLQAYPVRKALCR